MSYCRPSSEADAGEAGDGVLGRGVGRRVGPRRMGRDRAVVDDPPALAASGPSSAGTRCWRAQERAGQVDVDHRLPLLVGQLLERHWRGAGAGIVEQQVEPAEASRRPCRTSRSRPPGCRCPPAPPAPWTGPRRLALPWLRAAPAAGRSRPPTSRPPPAPALPPARCRCRPRSPPLCDSRQSSFRGPPIGS